MSGQNHLPGGGQQSDSMPSNATNTVAFSLQMKPFPRVCMCKRIAIISSHFEVRGCSAVEWYGSQPLPNLRIFGTIGFETLHLIYD